MSTSSAVSAARSLPGGTAYLFWASCRQNVRSCGGASGAGGGATDAGTADDATTLSAIRRALDASGMGPPQAKVLLSVRLRLSCEYAMSRGAVSDPETDESRSRTARA